MFRKNNSEDKQKMNCCIFQQTFRHMIFILTILTGKNFWTNLTQEFVKIECRQLLIDLFYIITQAVTFYKFHYLILKRTDI